LYSNIESRAVRGEILFFGIDGLSVTIRFFISRHIETGIIKAIAPKCAKYLIHFTGNSDDHRNLGVGDQFVKTVTDGTANNCTYA
jgi:hypothetical protein